MQDQPERLQRFTPPEPQQPWRAAVEKAVAALRHQPTEQLAWLGAQSTGGVWRIAVLEDFLLVDRSTGCVTNSVGNPVRPSWQVLVLHYLSVSRRPDERPPQVTFADLASGRGYASVYQERVIGRLCATAGRDEATLRRAAEAVKARRAEGGDAAFELDVLPRVRIRLVWHADDEEFSPAATFLLPDNIEEFFPTEDIVVLCECCVSRLAGRPF